MLRIAYVHNAAGCHPELFTLVLLGSYLATGEYLILEFELVEVDAATKPVARFVAPILNRINRLLGP